MSSEICRNPRAYKGFIKDKSAQDRSGAQVTYWESRINSQMPKGEPMASGRSGNNVEGQMMSETAKNSSNESGKEKLIYSTGVEKPTLGEVLWEARITRETVDPHARLDYSVYHQPERLSEALQREREGKLTRRWHGYLRDVRAWFAAEHKVAFRGDR
jgi:hypothetical protein